MKKCMIPSPSYNSQTAISISNKLKIVSAQTIEKKYAKNKQMELAMAFKTRLLYGEQNSGEDAISEETKNNFLKLFEWITKECNDTKTG
ncbi:hypothetical protein HpCK64_06810 [Helicobacter pylori]